MFNIKITAKINHDALEKAVLEGAVKQFKEKLRHRGVSGVTVTPRKALGKVELSLSGPEDQVEKARKILGGK